MYTMDRNYLLIVKINLIYMKKLLFLCCMIVSMNSCFLFGWMGECLDDHGFYNGHALFFIKNRTNSSVIITNSFLMKDTIRIDPADSSTFVTRDFYPERGFPGFKEFVEEWNIAMYRKGVRIHTKEGKFIKEWQVTDKFGKDRHFFNEDSWEFRKWSEGEKTYFKWTYVLTAEDIVSNTNKTIFYVKNSTGSPIIMINSFFLQKDSICINPADSCVFWEKRLPIDQGFPTFNAIINDWPEMGGTKEDMVVWIYGEEATLLKKWQFTDQFEEDKHFFNEKSWDFQKVNEGTVDNTFTWTFVLTTENNI